MREIKFIAIYQSPNTDEPNKLLVSEPIDLEDMIGCNFQVDFTDGGYLMSDEMEAKYTKWVQYTGLKDKKGKEIYGGDILTGLYWQMSGKEEKIVYDVWYKTTYPYLSVGAHYQLDEVIGNIYENPELLNKED